jgi:hypothetical protein
VINGRRELNNRTRSRVGKEVVWRKIGEGKKSE